MTKGQFWHFVSAACLLLFLDRPVFSAAGKIGIPLPTSSYRRPHTTQGHITLTSSSSSSSSNHRRQAQSLSSQELWVNGSQFTGVLQPGQVMLFTLSPSACWLPPTPPPSSQANGSAAPNCSMVFDRSGSNAVSFNSDEGFNSGTGTNAGDDSEGDNTNIASSPSPSPSPSSSSSRPTWASGPGSTDSWPAECLASHRGFVNVQAVGFDMQSGLFARSSRVPLVMVVAQESLPPLGPSFPGDLLQREDVFADYPDFESGQPFQVVSLPALNPHSSNQSSTNGSLSSNHSGSSGSQASSPSVSTSYQVAVYSDVEASGNQIMAFSIQAFCSKLPGCPLNCSGRGRCGRSGACICQKGWGGAACHVAVASVNSSVVYNLSVSDWQFYSVNVQAPHSKVLVEMVRLSGDLILFGKRQDDGSVPYGLPTLSDYNSHSDIASHDMRQDFHQLMWEDTSEGLIYVGVYNNGVDVDEPGRYILRVTVATGEEASTLCPWNCGVPPQGVPCPLTANRSQCFFSQGTCQPPSTSTSSSSAVSAGSQCQCFSGFAGPYCQGTLTSASLNQPVSGQVSPGHWSYINFTLDPSFNNDLIIRFSRVGGQLYLIAGLDGMQALLSDLYRFPPPPSNISLTNMLSVFNKSLQGPVVFGIFNLAFFVQEDSTYELEFITLTTPYFWHSPFLYVVYGVTSVLLVFVICMVVKRWMARSSRARARATALSTSSLTYEMSSEPLGLDPELIHQFPLLHYSEDALHSQDTTCPVCLCDYEDGCQLRRLPPCGHCFHVGCVDSWLRSHRTCPICRADALSGSASAGRPEPSGSQDASHAL